jgi:integrase
MAVARPRVKVHRALMEESFEPMERASLKNITFKTVFFVALATAQRRSELHALYFENISFNKHMTLLVVLLE